MLLRNSLLALAAALLVGCAGAGGPLHTSPFEGTFDGAWARQDSVVGQPTLEEGTADFTVNEAGVVSGVFRETKPLNRTGSVTGFIETTGDIEFSVSFSGGPVVYSGTLALDGSDLEGFFGQNGVGYGGNFPFMDLQRD